MQPERRTEQRSRTLLSGTVRDRSSQSTISCAVRNLGGNGARIAVSNTVWLPDVFDLEIAGREGRRAARTVWRAGGAAGVKFIDDAPSAEASAKAEIERLRLANATLQQRLSKFG
jgi:hypothetical protein